MKKSFVCFVLLLMSCCLSNAATKGPITLEFWNGFTGPDCKYFQQEIDAFNEEYKGQIQVNMVTMRWDDFYSKLALAVRTLRGPDIGVVHFDNIAVVVYQGVVMELDKYVDQFPREDFVKSVWNVSNIDGHQYGIPLDFHPLVFYWNKELFAKVGLDPENPPKNRKEFLEVCKVLKDADLKNNGGKVWPCMIPSTWPHFLLWQHIFFCNGGEVCDPNYTKATYDSPAGRDAIGFLYDLIYKYQYSPPNIVGTPGSECMDSFMRGNLAMMIDGVWMLTSFKDTNALDFGAKAMINLGTGEDKVWSGSHTMVLFNKRKPDEARTKAAITFVRYISDHSYEWANTGMIPARYSVLSSEKFLKLPFLPGIAADIEKFTFPAPHYKYPEAVQPLTSEYISLCFLNKLDPNTALKKAAITSTARLSQDLD